MSELAYVSATVHGHVQGVFYRAFVSRIAKNLSLKGYVRNLPSPQSVEIHAEGDKAKLEELLEQLKIGPPESFVEKIDTNWSEYTGKFSSFEVKY